LFQIAQAQFDKVAEYLGPAQPTKDLLRYPLRENQFAIPVRMADGTDRVFRGVPSVDRKCGAGNRKA